MLDDPRWDPEMRAMLIAGGEAAAKLPPLSATPSPDEERAFNEALFGPSGRAGPTMAETIDTWATARGRRIFCRVHRPRTDKILPVGVYFHGGGWYFSSVDTHDCVARIYAAAGEIAVVNVDYALSPEAKFPQALEECVAIVQHIAAHGGDWKIDGSRIVTIGDSAGGNLALGTALALRDRKGPALRGVLAAYPVCDCDFATRSYLEFAGGPPLTADKMRFFWKTYVAHEADMLHPWASPLRADLAGLPPVMLHVGELDVLRSEVEAMGDKLHRAGVAVDCEVFPGLAHGFMRAAGVIKRAGEARDKAGAWLRRVTA
jgi:acetyl esterase